jgi:hypothetical protein
LSAGRSREVTALAASSQPVAQCGDFLGDHHEFQVGAKAVSVKLLMTWDILPGREQEYFEFVVRDFIPGLQRLGMEPSDAWFTMYGEQPQILVGAQVNSINALQHILKSTDWDKLTQQLLDYVENFKYKVAQARSGFQM